MNSYPKRGLCSHNVSTWLAFSSMAFVGASVRVVPVESDWPTAGEMPSKSPCAHRHDPPAADARRTDLDRDAAAEDQVDVGQRLSFAIQDLARRELHQTGHGRDLTQVFLVDFLEASNLTQLFRSYVFTHRSGSLVTSYVA